MSTLHSSPKTSVFKPLPPPWTLKGTIYTFVWYISSASAESFPSFAYSPLEASSTFASQKPKGGISMVQIIRYTETPVGPYDEFVLVPGQFEYEHGGKKGNAKVSRAYVSQEKTCYNGRKNWNVPKHLARFSFTPHPSGGTEILVFPYDTTRDTTESRPSSQPFFRGIYKPISYIPSFFSSTTMAKYVGIDLHIVQPPLPEGKGSLGELPGTDKWCKLCPLEYSRRTSLGWWDLRQDTGTGEEVGEQTSLLVNGNSERGCEQVGTGFENWWPGFGRWRIGLKMEDATIYFDEGKHWC